MNHMTPRAIAYCACLVSTILHMTTAVFDGFQLRFAFSSQETWHQMDGEFDMCEMYWNIVRYFETAGTRADELLTWWDQYVARMSCYLTESFTGRSLAQI